MVQSDITLVVYVYLFRNGSAEMDRVCFILLLVCDAICGALCVKAFANIPTFDNVSDLNNANGFTIALGQIDSSGNVTGATTTDALTTPINYFYITSTSNATTGNVEGGGDNCSAGPVTLEVVNG